MKHGSVKMRYIVCITFGLAGVGKTCLKLLLMGLPPPELRTSTNIAESPIRIEIRRISEMKLKSCGEHWIEVNNKEMMEIIAGMIIIASEKLPGGKQFEGAMATNGNVAEAIKMEAETKENFLSRFLHRITGKKTNRPDPPPSSPDPVLQTPISSSLSEAGQRAVKIIMDRLVEVITRLKNPSTSSKGADQQSEIDLSDVSDWVLFSDCGGQPEYQELLPLFINYISAVLYVMRLIDKLDKVQQIDYFEEDEPISTPHQSQLSNKETIGCLFNSSKSFSTEDQPTKVILVGTHLDELRKMEKAQENSSGSKSQTSVSGSSSSAACKDCVETLEEKNKLLNQMLGSDYTDQLTFYPQGMQQLIFAVNTLERGEQAMKMARLIRNAVESSSAKEVEVPIWWYIFELLLQELAKQLQRKVIIKAECLELAHKLGFSERDLEAALRFFNQLNVIKYTPEVLPKIIFTDSQVPLDKVSELIRENYRLRGGTKSVELSGNESLVEGKLKYFRDQGVVSRELMSKFRNHYTPGIFCEEDLSELLRHMLVFAPIPTPQWENPSPDPATDSSKPQPSSQVDKSPSQPGAHTDSSRKDDSGPYFFMPASLVTLTEGELDQQRVTSPSVATLLVQFPKGSRRAGIFSCFTVHLIRHCGWDLLLDAKIPLYRNCIKFHPNKISPPVTITVIDSKSFFEVHAHISPDATNRECARLLPILKGSVFGGITAACKALNYHHTYPEIAFFCPHHEATSSGASLIPSLHPASVRPDRQYWCCDVDTTISGKLQSRHHIWFGIGKIH